MYGNDGDKLPLPYIPIWKIKNEWTDDKLERLYKPWRATADSSVKRIPPHVWDEHIKAIVLKQNNKK